MVQQLQVFQSLWAMERRQPDGAEWSLETQLEMIRDGTPRTPWLAFGDRVRIEVIDANGQTVFGAIEQHVRMPGHRPITTVS